MGKRGNSAARKRKREEDNGDQEDRAQKLVKHGNGVPAFATGANMSMLSTSKNRGPWTPHTNPDPKPAEQKPVPARSTAVATGSNMSILSLGADRGLWTPYIKPDPKTTEPHPALTYSIAIEARPITRRIFSPTFGAISNLSNNQRAVSPAIDQSAIFSAFAARTGSLLSHRENPFPSSSSAQVTKHRNEASETFGGSVSISGQGAEAREITGELSSSEEEEDWAIDWSSSKEEERCLQEADAPIVKASHGSDFITPIYTFVVGTNNQYLFHIHLAVLVDAPVLWKMCTKSTNKRITLPEESPTTIGRIFQYLYRSTCDGLEYDDERTRGIVQFKDLAYFYLAADKYGAKGLKIAILGQLDPIIISAEWPAGRPASTEGFDPDQFLGTAAGIYQCIRADDREFRKRFVGLARVCVDFIHDQGTRSVTDFIETVLFRGGILAEDFGKAMGEKGAVNVAQDRDHAAVQAYKSVGKVDFLSQIEAHINDEEGREEDGRVK